MAKNREKPSREKERPKAVQIALNVAERFRESDFERYQRLSASLPPIALALEQQGQPVDEEALFAQVSNDEEKLVSLYREFKRASTAPRQRSYEEIHADVIKPLLEAKECMRHGDTAKLDKIIKKHGYNTFTKKILGDLVSAAIDANNWQSIEHLIKNHNWRFEDNLIPVVQRIGSSENYNLFYLFHNHFNASPSPTMQYYASQFAFYTYYAFFASSTSNFANARHHQVIVTDKEGKEGITTLEQYFRSTGIEFNFEWIYATILKAKKEADDISKVLSQDEDTLAWEYDYFQSEVADNLETLMMSMGTWRDPEVFAGRVLLAFLFRDIRKPKKQPMVGFEEEIYGEFSIDAFLDWALELRKEKQNILEGGLEEEQDKAMLDKIYGDCLCAFEELAVKHYKRMFVDDILEMEKRGRSGANTADSIKVEAIHHYLLSEKPFARTKKERSFTFSDFHRLMRVSPLSEERLEDYFGETLQDILSKTIQGGKKSIVFEPGVKGRVEKFASYIDPEILNKNESIKYGLLLTCICKRDTLSFNRLIDKLSLSQESYKILYEQAMTISLFHMHCGVLFVVEWNKSILDKLEHVAKTEYPEINLREDVCAELDNFLTEKKADSVFKCYDYKFFDRIKRHGFEIGFDYKNNKAVVPVFLLRGMFSAINKVDLEERQKVRYAPVLEILLYTSLSPKNKNAVRAGNLFIRSMQQLDYLPAECLRELHWNSLNIIKQELQTHQCSTFLDCVAALESRMQKEGLVFTPIDIEKHEKFLKQKEQRWKEISEKSGAPIHDDLAVCSPFIIKEDTYIQILSFILKEITEYHRDARRFIEAGVIPPEDPHAVFSSFGLIQSELGEDFVVEFSVSAYALAECFQTKEAFQTYVEKWGRPHPVFLASLSQSGILVKEDYVWEFDERISGYAPTDVKINRKAWSDAVVQCGSKMLTLRKYASFLGTPLRSDDGRSYSVKKTIEALADRIWKEEREIENPTIKEIARLCLQFGYDRDVFKRANRIVKPFVVLPNMVNDCISTAVWGDFKIDGSRFGIEGACFYKLPFDDMRGMFLGNYVDCCQTIGSSNTDVHRVVEHGVSSSEGAFFVVEKEKEIIGAVWAWRDKNGVLVFDSLETLGGRVKPENWEKICEESAKEFSMLGHATALVVGQGGDTPVLPFPQHQETLDPIDTEPYDSKQRYEVWSRNRGLQKLVP